MNAGTRRHPLILTALIALACSGLVRAQQFLLDRNATLPGANYQNLPACGDIDGDGDLDIVTSRDYAGNYILINDGHGRFVDERKQRLTYIGLQATYCVGLADFDGDGDLDLFNTNDHTYREGLFLNNGKGYFTDVSATHVPLINHDTTGHAIADFDGDGDVDVVILSSRRGGVDSLLLNNGKGRLSLAPASSIPATNGFSGMARDLDGDGDMDLVAYDSYYLRAVLLNSGKGVFTRVVFPAIGASPAAPFGLDDLNGDGLPDFYFTKSQKLFFNQGGNSFKDVSATNLPASLPANGYGAMAVDVDGDGDLDIPGSYLLLINDGKGKFTDRSKNVGHCFIPSLAADFDGDLDIDLVLATYSNLRLIRNLHRHLDAPAAATLGTLYKLNLYSQPGYGSAASWGFPFLSARTTPLVLPGLGTFSPDPTLLLSLPMVAINATGRRQIQLQIPNQPILRGVNLALQCVLVTPIPTIGLTNCSVEPIR